VVLRRWCKENVVSTSKAGARVGGLALALGVGAVVMKRRRSLASADSSRSTANAVADTATPHFEFTGQPSGNTTVAVTVLRTVGAVTDFLGIDFGTQIASSRPHSGRQDAAVGPAASGVSPARSS
jgi:hypothetical protein